MRRSRLVGVDGPEMLLTARTAAWIGPILGRKLTEARRRREPVDPDLAADIEAIVELGRAHTARQLRSAPPSAAGSSGSSADDASLMLVGMSSIEAARELGCSDSNVRDLARRGTLPGRRAGRAWVFDPADVADYAARREER